MNEHIIHLIEKYQKGHTHNHIKKCRFEPTCSQYAKEAYQRYHFFYASILTIWRLIRCNPLHKMAYDPVPIKRKYRTKYPTLEDTFTEYRIKYM